MCGICGIYHLDGRPVQRDLKESKYILKKMNRDRLPP